MAALGVTTYSTATYALYNSWYKDYPKTKFHYFNDGKEWLQMDKVGHVFSSYFQTSYSYDVAKWTGLSNTQSVLTGAAIALISQTTLEVMDGYSQEWGFSMADFGANLVGTFAFGSQQLWLGKQIFQIKESSLPRRYDEQRIYNSVDGLGQTSLEQRANVLFGEQLLERALKDYNVQTYWASIDVNALTGWNQWPSWLNLAVGLGAENLYGGFENKWVDDTSNKVFDLSSTFPRYRQYYLSLDINWRNIRTNKHLLNGIFNGLNIFKVPSPTLEYGNGEWRFHLLFW